jgi:hypothetical protein
VPGEVLPEFQPALSSLRSLTLQIDRHTHEHHSEPANISGFFTTMPLLTHLSLSLTAGSMDSTVTAADFVQHVTLPQLTSFMLDILDIEQLQWQLLLEFLVRHRAPLRDVEFAKNILDGKQAWLGLIQGLIGVTNLYRFVTRGRVKYIWDPTSGCWVPTDYYMYYMEDNEWYGNVDAQLRMHVESPRVRAFLMGNNTIL